MTLTARPVKLRWCSTRVRMRRLRTGGLLANVLRCHACWLCVLCVACCGCVGACGCCCGSGRVAVAVWQWLCGSMTDAGVCQLAAWDKLEREVGWRGMLFPKEIICAWSRALAMCWQAGDSRAVRCNCPYGHRASWCSWRWKGDQQPPHHDLAWVDRYGMAQPPSIGAVVRRGGSSHVGLVPHVCGLHQLHRLKPAHCSTRA